MECNQHQKDIDDTLCESVMQLKQGGRKTCNPSLLTFTYTVLLELQLGFVMQKKFKEFCDWMVKGKSEYIQTFVREDPKCATIHLSCSDGMVWIVAKEKSTGIRVQIFCEKKEGCQKTIEWLQKFEQDCKIDQKVPQLSMNAKSVLCKSLTCLRSVFWCGKSVEDVNEADQKNVESKDEEDQKSFKKLKASDDGSRHLTQEPSVVSSSDDQMLPDHEVPLPDLPCNPEPTPPEARKNLDYYKLLIDIICSALLFEEVTKLKKWAAKKIGEGNFLEMNQYQVLRELERCSIISSTNLKEIREFFSQITRFDIVHYIDSYFAKDYSLLVNYAPKRNGFAKESFYENQALRQSVKANQTTATGPIRHCDQQNRSDDVSQDKSCSSAKQFTKNKESKRSAAVAHDKPKWLCTHYKRLCYVKFDCCEEYWPCHRCHNDESKCGKKKLRSRDTKLIRCSRCNTEQQFSEKSQFCCNCNVKFAEYFCAPCKHLTGMDDHPYHCQPCGICRIHSDHSYHCDVCGVCLDTKLRNNHKCREGSAHDECCICLEDAFTGCQILPCSHKVHKECGNMMIKRGMKNCPICRQSFAHFLVKRPASCKSGGKC